MSFEPVSVTELNVGDRVRAYGFVAEVVERRSYPMLADDGVTYGFSDRPCVQVDLRFIAASDPDSALTFRRLCERGSNLATLQGNHHYVISRLKVDAV